MAITSISTLTQTGVTSAPSGGSCTIALPSSPDAGDVLVIGIVDGTQTSDATYGCSTNGTGDTITKASDQYSNDTNDTNMAVFVIVVGTSGVLSSITFTGANGTTPLAYSMRRYSGVDTATPLDLAAQVASGINTDLAQPAGIIPPTSGARVVCFMGASQNTLTAWTSNPSALDFVQQAQSTKGRIASEEGGSSVSGTIFPYAVGAGDQNARDSWVSTTIALRPASGAAPARDPARSSFWL